MTAAQLDPQAKRLLDEVNAVAALPPWERPIAEVRADHDAFATSVSTPGPEVASVVDREIPGPHGPIEVRIYRPLGADATALLPVYINFHGSGFVVLDIRNFDHVCRAICNGANCIVVAVNYHKAPEYKFPMLTDEAWASTCWVAAHCADLGGDAGRIAIGGDSAGGCLAAVVAQRAAAEGGPPLVFQLLVYPVTDTRENTQSYRKFAGGYLLTASDMHWFFDCYFNDEAEKSAPAAAPLRAVRMTGLPPALLMTAGFDPLHDEGVAYAEKLREAGVAVEHVNYAGHIHGFWGATRRLDIAAEAHATACAALRRAFTSGAAG